MVWFTILEVWWRYWKFIHYIKLLKNIYNNNLVYNTSIIINLINADSKYIFPIENGDFVEDDNGPIIDNEFLKNTFNVNIKKYVNIEVSTNVLFINFYIIILYLK